MGEFFLNEKTYENNNKFFYIILEYDRPIFKSFRTQISQIFGPLQRIQNLLGPYEKDETTFYVV